MPESIPYLSNIISALAAGAIGAGASRHMTRRLPGEDEDTYRKRLALNTGIGALGGAATGAALPTIASGVSSVFGKGEPSNNPAKWIGNAGDALVSATGPAPVAGALIKGYFSGRKAEAQHDKAIGKLQAKADAARTTFNSAINDPALRRPAKGILNSAERAVTAAEAGARGAKWNGRVSGGLWGALIGAAGQGLVSKYMP